MRYIVAVGSELHFTRAAERVHVAQPSLSKQIRNVEAELGVELFKRTRKKVEVTEPGRVFIENAQQALLYADRAQPPWLEQREPDSSAGCCLVSLL